MEGALCDLLLPALLPHALVLLVSHVGRLGLVEAIDDRPRSGGHACIRPRAVAAEIRREAAAAAAGSGPWRGGGGRLGPARRHARRERALGVPLLLQLHLPSRILLLDLVLPLLRPVEVSIGLGNAGGGAGGVGARMEGALLRLPQQQLLLQPHRAQLRCLRRPMQAVAAANAVVSSGAAPLLAAVVSVVIGLAEFVGTQVDWLRMLLAAAARRRRMLRRARRLRTVMPGRCSGSRGLSRWCWSSRLAREAAGKADSRCCGLECLALLVDELLHAKHECSKEARGRVRALARVRRL